MRYGHNVVDTYNALDHPVCYHRASTVPQFFTYYSLSVSELDNMHNLVMFSTVVNGANGKWGWDGFWGFWGFGIGNARE